MWFMVDDKLHNSGKARQVSLAAMGLWTLCGSWSGSQETDGWLPEWAVRQFEKPGEDVSSLVDELVAVGLWEPAARQPVDVRKRIGEASWVFHDWGDYQWTRERLVERRKSQAQRTARSRARKAAREGSAGLDDTS